MKKIMKREEREKKKKNIVIKRMKEEKDRKEDIREMGKVIRVEKDVEDEEN